MNPSNTGLIEMPFEVEAQKIVEKYKPFLDKVSESSIFKKSGRAFTPIDAIMLGRQYEAYLNYAQGQAYSHGLANLNESASASDLSVSPRIAMDLITTKYAISPAPLLCSMQTIPEESGYVYFNKITAGGMVNRLPYTTDSTSTNGLGGGFGPQTRGGLNPGDEVFDTRRGWVNNSPDYITERVRNEVIDVDTWTDTQVKNVPIRSNKPVRLVVKEGTTTHEGTFINNEGGASNVGILHTATGWATGEINYSNGHLRITSNVSADEVTISYQQDFERAAALPRYEHTLSTINVTAEIFAASMPISAFKAYQFNKRFGRIAEDKVLMDLAGAMANAEAQRIVTSYVEMANWIEDQPFSAGRPVEFDMKTPDHIAEFAHRQSFRHKLISSDSRINRNSGRGAANRYIVGHQAGEFVSSIENFEWAPANLAVGTHVLGYYNGKPVIRTNYLSGFKAPEGSKTAEHNNGETFVDPENVVIAAYVNPQDAFDAPLVEATYMPVYITNPMQVGYNLAQNERMIASWKAFQPVVPHYTKAVTLYHSAA